MSAMVEVYGVQDDGSAKIIDAVTVDGHRLFEVKRSFRKLAADRGWFVRSISKMQGAGFAAYVTRSRPDARERGKPVKHTGVVGKGREIRRRPVR